MVYLDFAKAFDKIPFYKTLSIEIDEEMKVKTWPLWADMLRKDG